MTVCGGRAASKAMWSTTHAMQPRVCRTQRGTFCSSIDQMNVVGTIVRMNQRNVSRLTWCQADGSNSVEFTTTASLSDEKQLRSEVTRRIKNLGRQGKVKEAIKELANMARLGVQPDTLSATALVDACVRSRKMDMAESVFEELFGELLVPDEVAFMVLIRGYGDEYPPRWTSIATVLSSMEHTYGILPTVLTYNTLLEVCSKTNDEDRGVEIIDRMQDAGVVPNDLSFEAVRQRKSLRSMLKKLV